MQNYDLNTLTGCSMVWNENLDSGVLSQFISPMGSLSQLEEFFSLATWNEVFELAACTVKKDDFFSEVSESSCHFKKGNVEIYTSDDSIVLTALDFYKLVQGLLFVLIEGAIEHHHVVRYDEKWEHFLHDYENIKGSILCIV